VSALKFSSKAFEAMFQKIPQFGAALFKTTELFERLFGLTGLDQLPDPSQFDPTPEDERELRERLLNAGEQRAE